MEIRRYSPDAERAWNEFVSRARQQSVLFDRGYMDYHSQRFTDHSLMAYDSHGRVAALLPANSCGDTLHSHQGLTYGGWITPMRHFNASTMLKLWDVMLEHLEREGFKRLIYKRCPTIYCRIPADDDMYALFRSGATLTACNLSSAFPLDGNRITNQSHRSGLVRAARAGVTCRRSTDIDGFMAMLARRLLERHDAIPVHTADEIKLLMGRFPEKIKLYEAFIEDKTVAGALIYQSATVAHTQYLTTNESGRACGALNALIEHVVGDLGASVGYFDFGHSCEDGGRKLNAGLEMHKSGLGGRSICYDIYTLNI